MEIERKYLVREIPLEYKKYPVMKMEQGYVSTCPVIRVRKSDADCRLTVKSKGLLARQEFELPLAEEEYDRLLEKIDGVVVKKKRYVIPLAETTGTTEDGQLDDTLKLELDVFEGIYAGLIYAEVEFPTEEAANRFHPPAWFFREVTYDARYHNSALASMTKEQRELFLKEVSGEYGERKIQEVEG